MRISDWSSDVCASDLAVPERLRSLFTANDKIDTSLADRRNARARFSGIHWGAIAASLILGLTIGLRPWMPGAPVAIDSGTLVAAGPLAEAPATQLASKQPGAAAVRIVPSFEDKAGRYRRRFESRAIDGLGCREQRRWTTRRQ